MRIDMQGAIALSDYIGACFAATGYSALAQFFVPISHLDTKRRGNRVQVEKGGKYRSFPFKKKVFQEQILNLLLIWILLLVLLVFFRHAGGEVGPSVWSRLTFLNSIWMDCSGFRDPKKINPSHWLTWLTFLTHT